MANEADDEQGTTVTTRLTRFLTESRDAGIPWQSAMSVAAVSINESGAIFRRRRRTDKAILNVACFPTRQILALEVGNPNLSNQALPVSWTSDPVIMEFMRANGWLGTNNQATRAFGRADLPDNPNDDLATMFDFLIDQRKGTALGAYSIGPTQIFLRFSPLAGGTIADRFPTFENLWDFWTARTAKAQWDTNNWNYLTTAPLLRESAIQCGDALPGNNCVETWLQFHQTGTVDWKTGRFKDYAARFAGTNRPLVFRIGRSISYPGI